jgi:hypothetical protein
MSRVAVPVAPVAPRVAPLSRPSDQQLRNIREAQQAYRDMAPPQQMGWDAYLWQTALQLPGTLAKQPILRRLFTVLRWGGLMFRPRKTENNWRLWSDVGWPLASAISHGGRVMIQLPRTRPGQTGNDDSFFTWLTNGQAGSGNCTERSGTHSTGNRLDDAVEVLEGRMKVLAELKGARFGAGQAIGTSSGKSYGINVALGGNLRRTAANNHLITDNGDHGHLYLFYRPPTPDKFGGMLVGTEGEAPGRWGASGNYHSWNIGPWDKLKGYRPSQEEGQFGQAFAGSGARLQLPDAANRDTLINGPDRYDSLLIDLTGTGWKFLKETHEPHWSDDLVGQAAQGCRVLTAVPKRLTHEMQQARGLGGPVGRAAAKYLQLPAGALQLRLALFTDEFMGRVPGSIAAAYQTEYRELILAIYGA